MTGRGGPGAEAPVPSAWSLRRRIGAVFTGMSILLVLLLAALAVATAEFKDAGDAVIQRWQPAVLLTQRVLTDLVDQETGLRGYALSHDRQFLQPYDEYRKAQGTDTARLHQLIGNDRPLQARLAAVDRAAANWERVIAQPALSDIAQADPAGTALIEGLPAKHFFDAIRAASSTLADHVQARSQQARNRRAGSAVVFVVALSLAAVAVIAVGLMLWRGLHRWVLTPADALRAQTRDVAGGNTYREIVPAGPREFAILGGDVESMRRQIAAQLSRAEKIGEQLRRRGEELSRSNADLQQFAYVASHDLSEPLRKVANFCQLLERQYGDQLDDRAREYIGFAVDGARRMQQLMSDLLRLSRVGRSTEGFAPVALDAALDQALATLTDVIADSGAQIERETPLPTVYGDAVLLTSVFENLVGNAVKYRRPDVAPLVRIRAEPAGEPGTWLLSVTDNGIGIEQEYAERIFVIFQRLHLRDRYPGTGIGLALCRKIVEFHGGRIWLADVESSPSSFPGATFRFTLPEGSASAQSGS